MYAVKKSSSLSKILIIIIVIMRIIYKGAKINKKQLGKRMKSKSFLN